MSSILSSLVNIDEEIRLEKETLKREFEWLLQTELNHTLQAIERCLNECSKKFAVVLEPSTLVDGHKILLRHPQQGEPVVCIASVDGDKISKADITLRLPGRLGAGKPLRTSIKEHSAWKLRQIQDSANQYMLAHQQLRNMVTNIDKLSSPPLLCQAFSELASCLRKAEQVLVVPQLPSVAEIYSAELRSHFKPELPEDIIVHFHINAYRLVLTICNISQISKPITTVSMDHSFQVGSIFEYGANYYEVSSHIQIQSPVPWLSVVLQWLQEAQEITQDFIDKVEIFKGMNK